jgi:hypothetical protein
MRFSLDQMHTFTLKTQQQQQQQPNPLFISKRTSDSLKISMMMVTLAFLFGLMKKSLGACVECRGGRARTRTHLL